MSLINKTNMKKRLLAEAKSQRPKKKLKVVSDKTMDSAESSMHLWCKIHVNFLPKDSKEI